MSEWLPIETAPKDGTEILVCRDDWGRRLVCVARWSKNMQGSCHYGEMAWSMPGYQGIALEAVSPPPIFWMPLPSAPLSQPHKTGD